MSFAPQPIGTPVTLKALIRKAAARIYEEVWQAVGNFCALFAGEECYNFFKAAGDETN